jgi:hypothetical protein
MDIRNILFPVDFSAACEGTAVALRLPEWLSMPQTEGKLA